MTFRPKYITFDCYGTLTYYPMHQAAYDIYEGQLPPQQLQSFIKTFNDYRFDEAMGDWKPYLDILHSSLQRACRTHKLRLCAGRAQQKAVVARHAACLCCSGAAPKSS